MRYIWQYYLVWDCIKIGGVSVYEIYTFKYTQHITSKYVNILLYVVI